MTLSQLTQSPHDRELVAQVTIVQNHPQFLPREDREAAETKKGRILGATIAGIQAGELISEISVAKAGGWGGGDVERTWTNWAGEVPLSLDV